MDTNALLSIAFSVISNFTSQVPVPPASIPQKADQLEEFSVGRPFFPFDMYLRSKGGGEFWIRNGAVGVYRCQGSYFTLQDPRLIANFTGTSVSNEVFELGLSTVRNLLRTEAPLKGIQPVVKMAKPYKGNEVPFYDIRWPRPENPQIISIAEIELDAQRGLVVSLCLADPSFRDAERLAQISNVVQNAATRLPATKNSPHEAPEERITPPP